MTSICQNLLYAMGAIRIVLGLTPFLAMGRGVRLLGFPSEHENPTAYFMARLFGVRDIGLGVLVFYAISHPANAKFLILFNFATDLGDLCAVAIPLWRRDGIDRGVLTAGACALAGGLSWLSMWWIFL